VPVDRELDRLFQLPLGEFTAARNALAKSAGEGGAAIRALEKPAVPAWAVNQLYWRERRVYDALVRASERLRAAHALSIAGRKADLATVELHHAAALKKAADAVRDILAHSGDPATAATMKAVLDTLQALPGGGAPGRLTKPLAPLGFGALGALMKQTPAATQRALAEVVTFAPPKPAKPSRDEAAESARRARDSAKQRLTQLDAQAARAAKAVAMARDAFDRAQRARNDLDARLQAAAADAATRRTALDQAERDARVIDAERARVKAELARST
jgi:hypothetical protein